MDVSTTLTSVYNTNYKPNPSAYLNRHLACALTVGAKEATLLRMLVLTDVTGKGRL